MANLGHMQNFGKHMVIHYPSMTILVIRAGDTLAVLPKTSTLEVIKSNLFTSSTDIQIKPVYREEELLAVMSYFQFMYPKT